MYNLKSPIFRDPPDIKMKIIPVMIAIIAENIVKFIRKFYNKSFEENII